ncbi:chromosomal replication initiator protein DnaA [candidate division TA06 bacterium]|uniref:Chromosomal replication initiator protein DnaA n=1 Tax=candidate division TA06 bacterium TaxID=2250710 RepID=A0A660SBZ4_UNCT6|nr:MAG: chromosomal replication initiator protein DnaA [candidate division TA06 bacterium]
MSDIINNKWQRVLSIIQKDLKEYTFSTWLKPTKASSLNKNILYVDVPNAFFADWINEHYLQRLEEISKDIFNLNIKIKLNPISDNSETYVNNIKPDPVVTSEEISVFLPKYTFDSFVVGSSNQFAYAGAKAVAEKPGKLYNPFFIYGGVGLGKTHLAQAIGNYLLGNNKKYKVYYTPAEKFMNDLVMAFQTNSTLEFKKRYRQYHVLILDDIQFLSGKVRLQEEIFHTFNALYNSHRQLVITSDKPPREIENLEERLVSRFQSGLIVDIQPPDLVTRIAILKNKIEKENLFIPEDVIFFIAENITSNIRELESAIIKLLAFASLTKTNIDLKTAELALKPLISTTNKKEVSFNKILEYIARETDINKNIILSERRTENIALARQIIMYLARKLTSLSLKEIAFKLNRKDHTTVMSGIKKIEQRMANDSEFKEKINTYLSGLSNE